MPTATAKPRSTSKPKSKSLYSVHPGVAMVQKWIADLPEKTGRSLVQWLKFIKKEGPADEKSRREWLKSKHNLGTNTAWWLAERASADPKKGFAEEDPQEYLRMADKYVDEMFSGAGGKAALRPIYDALLKLGLGIGPESKACPCQTIVPLYRNHVFAQIKPTTNTRIDLGFALGSMIKQGKKFPSGGKLLDTGGFAKKDRITHRIPITSLKEIDDDVKTWLKIAYDLDAKD